jgi:hypothetical protein
MENADTQSFRYQAIESLAGIHTSRYFQIALSLPVVKRGTCCSGFVSVALILSVPMF